MACMEHICTDPKCGAIYFNNGSEPARCDECFGQSFNSFFDEPLCDFEDEVSEEDAARVLVED